MPGANPFSAVGFHDFVRTVDRHRSDRSVVFYGRFERAVFKIADFFSFAPGTLGEDEDGLSFRYTATRLVERSQRFAGVASVDENTADELHP